jgi:hypothetical protein
MNMILVRFIVYGRGKRREEKRREGQWEKYTKKKKREIPTHTHTYTFNQIIPNPNCVIQVLSVGQTGTTGALQGFWETF